MPLQIIEFLLPRASPQTPFCWFDEHVWCWKVASPILIPHWPNHVQSHGTISTLVWRISHLHHTWPQSVNIHGFCV